MGLGDTTTGECICATYVVGGGGWGLFMCWAVRRAGYVNMAWDGVGVWLLAGLDSWLIANIQDPPSFRREVFHGRSRAIFHDPRDRTVAERRETGCQHSVARLVLYFVSRIRPTILPGVHTGTEQPCAPWWFHRNGPGRLVR